LDTRVVIGAEGAEVEIAPALGGAVSRYTVMHRGETIPIFATAPDPGRTGVFGLGSNVLAPWSNRLSGGGFRFDGQFHPLQPNLAGEPYPNHGNAFAMEWSLVEASPTSATLALHSDGPGPFRYEARLTYALEGQTLRMSLGLTNRSELTLPYGGGFHPWFVRTPRSRIGFAAAGVWTATPDHLPDRYLPTATHPAWDFSVPRPLPATWLNNAFTGWSGTARIEWPEYALAAEIEAAVPLRTLIVYSPASDSSFVSVEPVSHSVDAHNRTDPGTSPPQPLRPGESIELSMSVAPRR
jgi:aldose 1-epimerase